VGVVHPTGYPLFVLLGRIAALAPLPASVIVRLNLLSVACAAAATLAIYWLLIGLLRGRAPGHSIRPMAAFGALACGLAPTFWAQATGCEVHALQLSLTALLLAALVRALDAGTESANRRWWLLTAYACGLACANHLTSLLVLPAVGLGYLLRHAPRGSAWARLPALAVAFALPLTLYAVLPLRARLDPPLNWGDPSTPERLLRHVTAAQYRVWMFSSSEVAMRQARAVLAQIPREYVAPILCLAGLGLWRLGRRDRRLLAVLATVAMVCVVYAINYDIKDILVYLLPCWLVLGIAAAVGAAALLERAPRLGVWGGSALLGLLLIWQAAAHWRHADQSGNHLAEDYTRSVLAGAAPDAVILSYQWDHFVSPALYYREVERVRPDVVVIDKELMRRSWYVEQILRRHPRLAAGAGPALAALLPDLRQFERGEVYDAARIEARFRAAVNAVIDAAARDGAAYLGPEIEPEFGAAYARVPELLMLRLVPPQARGTYLPAAVEALRHRPWPDSSPEAQQLRQFLTGMIQARAAYEAEHGRSRELARWRDLLRSVHAPQPLRREGGSAR
jgi:hypothetical protein